MGTGSPLHVPVYLRVYTMDCGHNELCTVLRESSVVEVALQQLMHQWTYSPPYHRRWHVIMRTGSPCSWEAF